MERSPAIYIMLGHGREVLQRKRTREHMHMRGLLPPAPAAAAFSISTNGLMDWVDTWTNKIKEAWNGLTRGEESDDESSEDAGTNPAAATNDIDTRRNRVRLYTSYVNTFVPSMAGGSLEEHFLKLSRARGSAGGEEDDDDISEIIGMDIVSAWGSGGGSGGASLDYDYFIPWETRVQQYNRNDVYRVMLGGMLLTGKMLVTLIRWPALLGASDNAIGCIMIILSMQCNEENRLHRVLLHYWENKMHSDTAVEDCLPYYNRGLLHACTSDPKACILLMRVRVCVCRSFGKGMPICLSSRAVCKPL